MSPRVRLDRIVFDAGTQVRAELDLEHVASLADAMLTGAQVPPIVLFHDGNQYYIADGFHRFMAAQRLSWREIDAEVKPGSKEDALWFALGANRTNGKNMTSADKKHAILLALQTWPNKSISQIAEQIGVNQGYASTIKKQVIDANNLPDRVTGKDGKSYPASRIPRKTDEHLETGDMAATPISREAARIADYESRRAAAAEGASAGVIRRLPRKSDAEIVINAMQALTGIVGALQMVDPATLSDDARSADWRATIGDVLGVLRTFHRKLERKAV